MSVTSGSGLAEAGREAPAVLLRSELTLESALSAAPEPGGSAVPGEVVPRRSRSLGLGLVVLLATGLLPGLAGTAWYLQQQRADAVEGAYAQAGLLADGATQSLGWMMQDAETMLAAIATRPKVRAMRPDDCDEVFADFRDINPSFKTLALRTLAGASVCSDLAQPPSQQSVQASPWFQAAVARGSFHASDVHVGQVQQTWTARLTHPVKDAAGQPAGLLITPVDLKALHARLFAQTAESAVVAVVDGANRVVVRSQQQDERVGKPAAPGVAWAIDAMRRERAADPSLSGVRRFAEVGIGDVRRFFVIRAVPRTDWVVVSALSEDQTLKDYRAARNRSLAAIAAVLALAGFAAWRVARGILVPIRGLETAARAMSAGDMTQHAPVEGPREVQRVAGEFNRMVDATEQARQTLAASEREYRMLLKRLPVAVVTHTPDTAIELFNDRACKLLRMTPEQMAGRQATDSAWCFVNAQGRPLHPSEYPISQVLASGTPYSATMLGIVSGTPGPEAGAPPGSAHTWVLVDAYPQFDSHQRLRRVVVVFVDVTLQHMTEQLRVAKDAAEAANKAKSVFLSRVSHELRTPLNAINGFSELILSDTRADPATKDSVVHVFNAGRHLLALINQILDLTRIEAGELVLSKEPVHLWPLLEECLAIVEPLAALRGVSLSLQPAPAAAGDAQCLRVAGEATRLRQVLMNLLSNAIKYNRKGGRVVLSISVAPEATADGPWLDVHVADTGIGMSAAQLAELFQPFNRLGAERTGIEGHGLGLTISRLLAQSMAGDLQVRSTPGEGTTFTLRLRDAGAAQVPAQPPSPRWPLPDELTEPEPVAPPLRVLCVEDNELNLQLMAQVVALAGGLEFVAAHNGVEGLTLAQQLRPALVLLNLDLPLLGGFELRQRLRQDPATADIPCWALTADPTPVTTARARAAGFERLVGKPVSIATLLEALEAWKRRGVPPPAPA